MVMMGAWGFWLVERACGREVILIWTYLLAARRYCSYIPLSFLFLVGYLGWLAGWFGNDTQMVQDK